LKIGLPWLRNNVLDLSACFPTSAPRSPTHSFAGAAHTFAKAFASMADPFACMLVAATVAAVPVTGGRCSRPSNKRKTNQNCKQNL
jgi:hypothetical protein